MMMMMDYGSQFTGSTISSDTMSGSVGSVLPRIRTVRLVRPSSGTLPPPNLTARYGPNLGFSLRGGREHGSGFYVSVVDPGSEAHRQGLKVGDQIIRINGFTIEDAVHKEVLQLISNFTHLVLKVRYVGMIPVKDRRVDPLTWHIISDGTSSTRSSPQLSDKVHDVRISIMIAPRTKLGCGICKGPEWKPGIFVQLTKEGGIARDAGLRPGDQILSCNNVDFTDIHFSEAVNLMKTARQLDLLVRKSAGSELFPSESSGYNSSASSVTGDQSPSWSDLKRLSIVKEESLELEDRLSQLDRLKESEWEKMEWDDIDNDRRYQFKPTIINLSENGTTITHSGSEECQNLETNSNTLTRNKANKLADSLQETKTVFVEVHQETTKTESSSICSYAESSSSLSSAISQELIRRSERNKIHTKQSIDERLQEQKTLKSIDTGKEEQHRKLMDEFKKVHRKMFKSTDDCESKEINHELLDRYAPPKSVKRQEAPQEKSLTRQTPEAELTPPPPPPPPPFDNGTNSRPQPKPKTPPPVPAKYSTLSFAKDDYHQPPPCPTPDYDTLSINSANPSQNDLVEMESLESYTLTNPNSQPPKPPNTFFNKPPLGSRLSNGSTTSTLSTKKQRPVSVTIGEYPSGSLRRQPGKLDFLQNGNGDGGPNESITTQFASELAHTLRRSNLRRRTESMENLLNNQQIQPQTNGSVTISLNNANKLPESNFKLQDTSNKSNRVTINICSMEKKADVPNGILKNGNGNHTFHNSNHKPLVQQKSITFGEMPTVINDQLLQA
ncbi:harmonin [Photinus pyralis]|nr:harmonin [Photinus pyralis]